VAEKQRNRERGGRGGEKVCSNNFQLFYSPPLRAVARKYVRLVSASVAEEFDLAGYKC